MEAEIEIAGHDLIVEYEIKITSHSYPATGPSYASGGEPGGGPEFEITVHGLRFAKQHADVPALAIPQWLEDILCTHLAERDDIYDAVCRAEYENDGPDPDDARDALMDREAD